jgi:hypothetical protein
MAKMKEGRIAGTSHKAPFFLTEDSIRQVGLEEDTNVSNKLSYFSKMPPSITNAELKGAKIEEYRKKPAFPKFIKRISYET